MNYLENKLQLKYNKERFDESKQSFFAQYFWRKLSLPLTFLFSYTFLTANMITVISFIFVLRVAAYRAVETAVGSISDTKLSQ